MRKHFSSVQEGVLGREHIGCKSISFHQKVITAIFHLWPAFIKKPLLYILGFLHAVWYPELRHLKNRTYINMHKKQIANCRLEVIYGRFKIKKSAS